MFQRFNKTTVAFLQAVFTSLLTQKLCSSQSLSPQTMSPFKRIRILDVTFFQLPDVFSSEYPGSGGSSNTAGVKIQLEYDKTYGTTCLKTVESRDLGYFDLKDLQAIHENEAYYISRLKLNTRVYIKNPTPEYFKTAH